MKTGYLKRNSTLMAYTPLKTWKGLKRGNVRLSTKTPLKRANLSKKYPNSPQSELDAIVSKVVRLGSADSMGMVLCVTCCVRKHWKEMQCGHFQKRGNLTTRYDMKNLGVQCRTCNCFNDGEEDKFAEFIDSFYGPGTAESLRVKARQIIHDFPYEQEIIKWSAVLEKIVEKNNGIEF